MSWGAALAALFGFLDKLAAFFREKQLRQPGVDQQTVAEQKEVLHEVQTAQDARAAAERDVVLNPGSLRDDDGFRRPD